MLVYTKFDENKKPHLYAAVNDIPADDDRELVYVDKEAKDAIELVDGDTYIDDKKGGIIRTSDGKTIYSVAIDDDGNPIFVVPDHYEEKVLEIQISNEPDTIMYYEDPSYFDYTGLEVTAIKELSGETVITDYTITPAEGSLVPANEETTVTVEYKGKTATFTVRSAIE